MFTVKKKPLTSNMIWDAENERPLCKFVKGILETNDEALVAKLSERGYEVTGEADADPSDQTPPETPDQNDPPQTPPVGDGEGDADSDDGEGEKEPEQTGEADAAPSTTAKRRSRK